MRSFKLGGSFDALNTNVGPGSTGKFVELVQQRLAALHLFIPQTGKLDQGTELALDAYHRLLGQGEGIETLDPKTVSALLNGDGTFHVRFPDQGQHAEGDLSDQLLAFIDGSKVYWIFPISSGKPSTPTILGNFQIYYKEPEYTSDGMYFLILLSRRLRDPRLRPGSRLPGQPWLHAPADSRRDPRVRLDARGGLGGYLLHVANTGLARAGGVRGRGVFGPTATLGEFVVHGPTNSPRVGRKAWTVPELPRSPQGFPPAPGRSQLGWIADVRDRDSRRRPRAAADQPARARAGDRRGGAHQRRGGPVPGRRQARDPAARGLHGPGRARRRPGGAVARHCGRRHDDGGRIRSPAPPWRAAPMSRPSSYARRSSHTAWPGV